MLYLVLAYHQATSRVYLKVNISFLQLLAEMAQEEMEIDLQPVAGYSVETLQTIASEPSGHTALSSHMPVLGEGGGSAAGLPADDAVVTPNAGTTREAAAEPDLQMSPAMASSGLQRAQGTFDLYQALPVPQLTQRPQVRRARRQQRIGGSQRTISTR